MKNNVLNFIEKMQKYPFWGLYLIMILPIVVLFPTFQPSDWTRSILFRIILTFLVSFILFRFLYKKDLPLTIPSPNNPVRLPLVIGSAFFLVLIISTLFSTDVRFSFFGSPTRSGGLLNLLFLFIFSLLLFIFVKGEQWEKLMKVHFLTGFVISSIAFVQYFGLLKNVFIAWEAGGPPSFLGSSTFLAIYMSFLVFSALYFLISQEDIKKKIFYLCLCLLFLFTIVISGARSTYIGIFIAFIFYFLFLPTKYIGSHKEQFSWLSVKKIRIIKAIFIILMSLVMLGVLLVNISPTLPSFIENNQRVSHFVHNRLSIKVVLNDLLGARFSAWSITWQAIKDKPLLGWGPENSYIGFEKYYDPTLPPGLGRLWWDRPHNIFLEIWANSGIIALIAYIAFWVVLFWQLEVFKKKNEDKKTIFAAHGIQAMMIAYVMALAFQFDSFSTYLIAFFFIGYALFLISTLGEHKEIHPPAKKIPFIKITAVLYVILLALFLWFWHVKPLYYNEKIVFIENQSCQKSITMAFKENWDTYGMISNYAALKYSDVTKSCAYVQLEKEVELAQKALASLKKASEVQPYFSRTWLFMGSFTDVLAAREKNDENKNILLIQAKEYLDKAVQLSPKRQEIFIEILRHYLVAEDYAMMKKTGEDCLTVDESVGACYWYLGVAQIFLGDQKNGKENIDKAVEKGYINYTNYKQLAVAYMTQGNWSEAVKAYEKFPIPSVNNQPDEAAAYYATMAYLYGQAGDHEKAGQAAFIVFKIQPNNPETVEFLRLLLGVKPNSLQLHSYLAYIYLTLGEREKYNRELSIIESAYSHLISQGVNEVNHGLALVKVYTDLAEYKKSLSQLISMTKKYPASRNEIEAAARLLLPAEHWAIYAKEFGLGAQ